MWLTPYLVRPCSRLQRSQTVAAPLLTTSRLFILRRSARALPQSHRSPPRHQNPCPRGRRPIILEHRGRPARLGAWKGVHAGGFDQPHGAEAAGEALQGHALCRRTVSAPLGIQLLTVRDAKGEFQLFESADCRKVRTRCTAVQGDRSDTGSGG